MDALNARRRWDGWWFAPIPVERVAIFRLLITGFALIDVTLVSNYVLRYSQVDRSFLDPVMLLEIPLRLGIEPVPSPGVHIALHFVMALALLASFLGYRTRLALAVAAPLYLYHWALFNSWGKVNHGKIPAVIALLVLVLAPAGYRYSLDALRRRRQGRSVDDGALDPLAGWALRVVGFVVVASYPLSAIAKLLNAGPSWPLQPVVQSTLLRVDGPVAEALADRPGLLVVAQTVTFVAEFAAILILFGRWPRNVLLAFFGAFHLGSYFLLETEFFGFLVCYAVFFDLEDIPARLRNRLGPRKRGVVGVG